MNRKAKWISAAFCAGCVLFGGALFSRSFAQETAKITKDEVMMRAEARQTSEVVAVVDPNCPIVVLGKEGSWYKIETFGQTGYVSEEFIETSQKVEETPLQEETLSNLLKPGMRSARVASVQRQLGELGYFKLEATGYYGMVTENAVREFQIGNEMEQDGIVGQDVLNLLNSGEARTREEASSLIDGVPVHKIDWWTEGKQVYPAGKQATVVDVATGKRFNVQHIYGTNHADSEPLTAGDTATMKEIFGGSWSWNRRAIILIVDGQAYAASMNGMPHGGQKTSNNNFNGHFCIHFANSKTHGSGKVDAQHQAAISTAAQVGTIEL